MINFHVTKHVYNDIIKGIKRHEYREHKPYWINRLAPVFPPLFARIYLGYSNTYLDIKLSATL